MRLLVPVAMVLIGLAGLAGGTAAAQPTTPAPAPPASTSDELADMVMDALQPGSGAPTTTPVAPPGH
jgi:hypothetical protein